MSQNHPVQPIPEAPLTVGCRDHRGARAVDPNATSATILAQQQIDWQYRDEASICA